MLNNFYTIYKEQKYFDRLIYLIIFLLPIFAISVLEWVSGLFILLFLLSIAYYFTYKKISSPLAKEEKHFIYILLFYFFIYLLSSVVNGWGEPQTHILGTMLHFVAIIPMILMFRHLKYLIPILIIGSIVACVVNIVYLYELPGKGVYGPLFSGPMTFLSCIFIISVFKRYTLNTPLKIALVILFILSILTIFELGSRSAFVALFFMIILYTLVYAKGSQRIYVVLLTLIIGVGSYYGNANVKMRIDRISHGVSIYFNEKQPEQAEAKFNEIHDIAARFEMWRASKYFVPENPILGFGPDEYANKIAILIDKKLISSVAQASHPHNAYFHELYAKGMLGLIAMLLVFYYPAYLFITQYQSKLCVSMLGLSAIISFSAFSLTESAAFNNNNFSSIMLIYISMILVSLFQKNKQT